MKCAACGHEERLFLEYPFSGPFILLGYGPTNGTYYPPGERKPETHEYKLYACPKCGTMKAVTYE